MTTMFQSNADCDPKFPFSMNNWHEIPKHAVGLVTLSKPKENTLKCLTVKGLLPFSSH